MNEAQTVYSGGAMNKDKKGLNNKALQIWV